MGTVDSSTAMLSGAVRSNHYFQLAEESGTDVPASKTEVMLKQEQSQPETKQLALYTSCG